MYADKITESMQLTIDETERRRSLQLAYNEQHGITPTAIIKARNAIIGHETEDDVASSSLSRQKIRQERKRGTERPLYASEFSTTVDIAADPVIQYMNPDELQRSITRMRGEMLEAAKKMEFIEAARLRDEIIKMEHRLETMKNQ